MNKVNLNELLSEDLWDDSFEDKEPVTLSDSQEEALHKLNNMGDIFVLMGYAGTGKTFLINHFLDEYTGDRRIITTATTHKALSVLNGDSTIHSYLGLKLVQKEGKHVLKPGKRPNAKFRDLLIVDEASMLNTEVLDHLLQAIDDYYLKVIFVGDPAQLPPVKENFSPVWKLDADKHILTDVMRQAADSPIIQAATHIRTFTPPNRPGSIAQLAGLKDFHDNERFICGNVQEMRKFFTDNITDKDFPQIISYKNKVVDMFNAWGRKQVIPEITGPYMQGEYVYVRSSHPEQTSRLEDFVEISDEPFEYDYTESGMPPISVQVFEITGPRVDSETFQVPTSKQDEYKFQENLNRLSREAKRSKHWAKFWEYMEGVNTVKHIYAMTCHRSQGSTFKDTIVDSRDMYDINLLYTALTRASERVFVVY